MKAAKSKVIVGKVDGPTAVFVAGKRRPPENKDFNWIEGMSSEVLCLGFMLDIGDIQKEPGSACRKEIIRQMCACDMQPDTENDMGDAITQLEEYLRDGEEIRIWYSTAPYSICGFYHLCSLLNCKWRGYKRKVYAVRLPEYTVNSKNNSITIHINWGEVAAEQFAGFLRYQKELSELEQCRYSMEWGELVQDNAPLRAVINGKVTGVPEDFYDFLILKRLTKEPVREARLIGDIIGCSRLSVSDRWYAIRINHLIDTGVIKIIRDAEKEYARIICLA